VIDLARILRTVVATLERAEVGYVVVGSTAAAAWGVARTTRDIDMVVVLDAQQLDAVVETFQAAASTCPSIGRARRGARASASTCSM
jgi:hypothetical protein